MEKEYQYAAVILEKLMELLGDEGRIDLEDLKDDNNLTKFIFAMSSIAPAMFYSRITGDEKNFLEFNHLVINCVFNL